ncbi:MAG: efflux RND transporter periplasmic adaptor subunit [Elusimicrobia bacterium]|nr:efflux RND transporter periplasmic adaptor subunit [Elusimicrobiota bacterium]
MRRALAALLLACAVPSFGAATGAVRRGTLEIRVHVTGTVVPEDVFRLKSAIDGRIEEIGASSYTWRGADQPLAMLVRRELAAILDARGQQDQSLVEDRWQRVYRPTPVRCPDTCFVLKVYARPHTWIKPQAVMFEAARKLAMVARVRPEDVPLIRDGMELTFWSVKDPQKKLKGRVTRYLLDIQGQNVDPGASFTLYMTPDRYFDPGTDWEGEIIPSRKSDVLIVPTAALIHSGGAVYLPMRVSTGTTTQEFTQITAGAEDKREFLQLDDSQLNGAERYKQPVDRAAIEKRRREIAAEAAAADNPAPERGTDAPAPAPGADKAPATRQPASVDDKGYGGDDPYGDQ